MFRGYVCKYLKKQNGKKTTTTKKQKKKKKTKKTKKKKKKKKKKTKKKKTKKQHITDVFKVTTFERTYYAFDHFCFENTFNYTIIYESVFVMVLLSWLIFVIIRL